MLLKKRLLSTFVFGLITVNLFMMFNYEVYRIYESYSLYVNGLLCVVLLGFFGQIKSEQRAYYVFIVGFTLYGFMTLFINRGGFGSVFTPLYSFLLMMLLSQTVLSRRQQFGLLLIFLSINVFWVYHSVDYFESSQRAEQAFNSNNVGFLLLYSYIFGSILMRHLRVKGSTLFQWILFGLSFWGIVNVQARSAGLGILLFCVLVYRVPPKMWQSYRSMMVCVIVIILIGTVFPFLYVLMYNLGMDFDIPFTTKSLYTGREHIWLGFIETMGTDLVRWLFGLGSHVDLWRGDAQNLHNNYLAVITSFGYFGYILYYGFIVKRLSDIVRVDVSETKRQLWLGFLVILVLSYVENALYYHPLFFLNFMLLGSLFDEEPA